jgi:integrase
MHKLYRRPRSPHWWVTFNVRGNRVRRSTGTDQKDVAETIAAQWESDARLETATGKRRSLTLDAALGRYWMDHAQHLPSSETIRHQGNALRRIIGKGTMLEAIGDPEVDTYVARRRGETARTGAKLVSEGTVNRELQLLRAVMTRAADRWNVAVADVRWKQHRLAEPDHRTRFLSADEADALLAGAAEHLRPPLMTALFTGLRLRNVLDLDWSQVNLRERTITVRVKSRKHKGGKVHSVPIAAPLLAVLVKLSPASAGPVFTYTSKKGGIPRPVNKMRRAFATALKRAGIEDFRWHDLRHTAASWMRQRGVPLEVIQKILAHSDIRLTQRYAHLAPGETRDAVNAIGQAWKPARGTFRAHKPKVKGASR